MNHVINRVLNEVVFPLKQKVEELSSPLDEAELLRRQLFGTNTP